MAALGHELLRANQSLEIGGLKFQPAETVFPALTCTVQGSFRTAAPAGRHGMVANGKYLRELNKALFWEQSAGLVVGQRIWEKFRGRGGKVAMLFWQQSMGEGADVILSPAPIHKHHGGMIMDCYSRPAGLYDDLAYNLGSFNLGRYWGPMACAKVGDWIADATVEILADEECSPDLCLAYLPSLDYDLQRYGPSDPRCRKAIDRTLDQIKILAAASGKNGYEIIIFGDYAIADCRQAVFPNRALCDAGLLATRRVREMIYPDLPASRAFAMVDHEIAHVYIRNPADVQPVRDVLEKLDGIGEIYGRQAQAAFGLDHLNSGELVLLAKEGAWLAYPWWLYNSQAPEYARHIDIHNKPGYDPCELFFGWPPMSVSLDTSRIRGTHGRAGPARQVAWASSFPLTDRAGNVLDIAASLKSWLDQE
ncbi:MAG: alkaline phosphatase family protein [Planctomycetes bacterium]|nr:alkaline phosphatase family protein [Planctomycetota bacterium]